MSPSRLAALVVVAAAALAHLPALAAGFVYDDHRFIEHNPALERIDPWACLTDPATASAASGTGLDGGGVSADIYRPLRTLLFSVERAVFGLAPAGWHLVSLALHALNAWLVLRLLRGLVGPTGLAAPAGALLFAVHPVTVESVAWVSSQGDLLALSLMLLALEVLARPGGGRALVGALLTGLACLAKESAVVLPLLLVLRDRALPSSTAPAWSTTLRRAGLVALVVAGYFALRQAVLPGLAQVPHPIGGVAASARGALAALAWYAGALAWPTGFRFETDLPVPLSWGEPVVVVGAGLLLTLLLLGLHAWRRGRPAAALFAAWGGLAALLPVSQVLVPLKTLAAERFLYPVLPCVAAGLGAAALALSRGRARHVATALLLAAVPWALVARARAAEWTDDVTLWEAVRADRPSNARAYEGLGHALLDKGRFSEGERAYHSYLRFNPYDGKARRRLADHLGNLAKTLRSDDPAVRAGSELDQRRREVRALEVAQLGLAVATWEDVGYELGRGSEALYQDTLRRLGDAALALGDLDQARFANDRLIERAGIDPAEAARVAREAPFARRVMRWFIAWVAVTTPVPAGIDPAGYAVRRDQRMRAVRALGLDPAHGDDALVRELEPALEALGTEAAAAAIAAAASERARAQALHDQLDLVRAELLELSGRAEAAARLRREVAQRALARPSPAGR